MGKRVGPSDGSDAFGWLSISLFAGAAVDATASVPLLLHPPLFFGVLTFLAGLFGLQAPDEAAQIAAEAGIFLRLNGAFLVIVALFYFVTAMKPRRYLGNAALAIFGRALGALVYLCWVMSGGASVFYAFVALNAAFAAVHAWAFGRGGGWSQLRDAVVPRDVSG